MNGITKTQPLIVSFNASLNGKETELTAEISTQSSVILRTKAGQVVGVFPWDSNRNEIVKKVEFKGVNQNETVEGQESVGGIDLKWTTKGVQKETEDDCYRLYELVRDTTNALRRSLGLDPVQIMSKEFLKSIKGL
jgi:hypothetical protein